MKTLILPCLTLLTILTGNTAADFPDATISNGLISARVLLPDATKGYYRGARFDWSGVISDLEYKGHTYFGQWNDNYDPLLHDAIMGPVDEFRDPLGFEEAKPGEEFVKIGVGILKKTDDAKYSFAKRYPVVNPGRWNVSTSSDSITFSQEIEATSGYSYRYEKVLRLTPGKPELRIAHRLTNSGRNAITTSTYNHNFFMIDKEPTGPNIKTTFDFDIAASGRGFGDLARAENRSVDYPRQLKKGENVFAEDLKVNKNKPERYSFTVNNLKSGAGVRVSCDRPADTMVYWACSTTACPEPYIHLSLAPGESTHWTISYEFF